MARKSAGFHNPRPPADEPLAAAGSPAPLYGADAASPAAGAPNRICRANSQTSTPKTAPATMRKFRDDAKKSQFQSPTATAPTNATTTAARNPSARRSTGVRSLRRAAGSARSARAAGNGRPNPITASVASAVRRNANIDRLPIPTRREAETTETTPRGRGRGRDAVTDPARARRA